MVASGDIVQLVVVLTQSGQQDVYENVLHFRAKGTLGSIENIATEYSGAPLSEHMAALGNHLSCSLLRVRSVVPATVAGVDHAVSPAVAGGRSGSDPLPGQCAAVVTWRTALAGRSYRGRTYLPGMLEGYQTNGVLSTGAGSITAFIQTWVNSIINTFGPAGSSLNWEFGIVSRVNNGAPRSTPVFTPVTAGVIRSQVYTQRRRRLGQGS